MTTIIERDVRSDQGMSSALTAIVAIVAVLAVLAVSFYILRIYPFGAVAADDGPAPAVIDVRINGGESSVGN